MKKALLFVTAALFGTGYAQDIHFSQFQTQPLTQNPALAGINFDFTVNLNYKDQWRQIGSPYKTFGASVDSKLNKQHSETGYFAAGVNFFSDKAGDSQMGTSQGSFSLAYHLKVAEHQTLGLGLQGGFAQRSISYDFLTWGNQYDGTNYNDLLNSGENFGANQFTHSDFAAGIVWAYNNQDGHINITDNHTSANSTLLNSTNISDISNQALNDSQINDSQSNLRIDVTVNSIINRSEDESLRVGLPYTKYESIKTAAG